MFGYYACACIACVQAEEEFIEMRKEMLQMEEALDETVKQHKEALSKTRAIEETVKVVWIGLKNTWPHSDICHTHRH